MGYLTPYSNLTDLIGITDLQANLFTSKNQQQPFLLVLTSHGVEARFKALDASSARSKQIAKLQSIQAIKYVSEPHLQLQFISHFSTSLKLFPN